MVVVGAVAAVAVPRHRWPRRAGAAAALGFLVPVVLLREADGGSASGLAFLALFPVLVIGAPLCAPVDWRRALLPVMVAGLVGVSTHRLVSSLAPRTQERQLPSSGSKACWGP